MKVLINILSYFILIFLLWVWCGNSDLRIAAVVCLATALFLFTNDLTTLLRRPIALSQRMPARIHFLLVLLAAMTVGGAVALLGALIADRRLYLIGMFTCSPAYLIGVVWNFLHIAGGGEWR